MFHIQINQHRVSLEAYLEQPLKHKVKARSLNFCLEAVCMYPTLSV